MEIEKKACQKKECVIRVIEIRRMEIRLKKADEANAQLNTFQNIPPRRQLLPI